MIPSGFQRFYPFFEANNLPGNSVDIQCPGLGLPQRNERAVFQDMLIDVRYQEGKARDINKYMWWFE